MKKVYYLSTCSTCKRIMDSMPLQEFQKQDIKTDKITTEQIEDMKALAGSYEALFSRKAMKYRAMGLNEKSLNEEDYKKLILDEYTFLKRPVFIIEDSIYIGNSKKVVEAVSERLSAE